MILLSLQAKVIEIITVSTLSSKLTRKIKLLLWGGKKEEQGLEQSELPMEC